MVRIARVLSIVALTAGLTGTLSACAGLDAFLPKVESVRPSITGIDLEGLDLVFDVRGSSAIAADASSPELSYSLTVDGSKVSSGRGARAKLRGRALSAKLPVRLTYGELARLIGSLRGKDEAPFRLEGAFELPSPVSGGAPIEVPFSHAGMMPIPKPPQIRVTDVRTSDVGLAGASLEIDAELLNRNGFALGLDGLGYALTLGGTPIGGVRTDAGGAIAGGGSRNATFRASLSATEAAKALLGGASPSAAELRPTGAIDTPWGRVPLR